MAPKMSIKLTNRSPKQPIRKLPASVDVPAEATVEDLKILIAKQAGISDYNRVGIFDPSTKKTLKNRKGRLSDEQAVVAGGEVLVKDLGLQLSWRLVFVIEYLGPLIFHPLALALRPYLYTFITKEDPGPLSQTQSLVFGMIMLHFIKREVETLFIHRFSAATMPFWNVFRNSFFYWFSAGMVCAYFVYAPFSLAAHANQPAIDALGVALYLFGEIANARVHWYLSTLRSPGGTERQIPYGHGFSIVTCPNYMYEVIAWLGMIVVSRDWSVVVFISIGMLYMLSWGKGKERAYRKEFGDKYKKKKYVMLPGIM